MEHLGGKRKDFLAKLIGGARMFKILSGEDQSIGQSNVQAAQNKLEELEIPIDAESTGGSVGKTVEFDSHNGMVKVTTKM